MCHRLWCVRRDDPDWWGALLNYVGSMFFMASAIASFTLKTTGETMNITVVNTGTFLGAVCFFVGAYLLFPPHEPVPDPIEGASRPRSCEREIAVTDSTDTDAEHLDAWMGRAGGHREVRQR